MSVVAATTVLGDRRHGDQYGILLAGAAMLLNDDVPSEDEQVTWMKDLGLEHCVDLEGTVPRETDPQPAVSGTGTGRDGQWSVQGDGRRDDQPRRRESRHGATKGQIPYKAAEKHLKVLGFRISESHLVVANRSDWIKKHVGDAYEGSWFNLLRTLKGAKAGDKPVWFGGYDSRATEIPLDQVPIAPVDTTPGFMPPDE